MKGGLLCAILTDFPERFAQTREVLVGEPPRLMAVKRHKLHRGRVILELEGLDDRNGAESLRGALVQVPVEQAVALPEGSFFWHQVIGLRVLDGSGRDLGTVAEILATGSNDVYVVRSERGELLLPAIKDVVKEIAPERGEMRVELLPGLEG